MKKDKRAQLFYDQIEQILNLYGDDDIKRKIEYVKNFLKEQFGVDELDSYIEIQRLHSNRLMWLFVSMLIDYEGMEQNPENLHGFGKVTSEKIKMPEEIEMKDKYMGLEVDKVFPYKELTEKEVVYIEKFLDRLDIDLESEFKIHYVLSAKQLICLIRGIMDELI